LSFEDDDPPEKEAWKPSWREKKRITREERDALHARVRRFCGEKQVTRCTIFDHLAVVEFARRAVIISLEGEKFCTVDVKEPELTQLAETLGKMYGG
jgi:hypothetical protein